MDERVAKLEQAMEELRAENRQLRHDLDELRGQLVGHAAAAMADDVEAADESVRSKISVRGRWTYLILTLCLVVLPVVLLTMSHLNAFWSTVIGAVNALIVYFLGPGAIRLLLEGLVRAIPAVLLGQTARITVDKVRKKKAR